VEINVKRRKTMFSIALAIFCSISIGLALEKDSKKERS